MAPIKNIYTVTFKHRAFRGEADSMLNIVALDFNEAMKKANENSSLVMSGKDDTVEVVKIELIGSIDVE